MKKRLCQHFDTTSFSFWASYLKNRPIKIGVNSLFFRKTHEKSGAVRKQCNANPGVIRGFAFSQLFYLSFLVGHENTQDEKGAKNQ